MSAAQIMAQFNAASAVAALRKADMTRLLYVEASPRKTRSASIEVGRAFLDLSLIHISEPTRPY